MSTLRELLGRIDISRLDADDRPDEKVLEARRLADAMDEWPVKQTPGRPDTRAVRVP